MHPKFILFASADKPLAGTFVYGMTFQHKDLIKGYGKVHNLTYSEYSTLYGSSGDYGQPDFNFLNRIPSELKGYRFIFTPIQGLPGNELPLDDVEWV